MSLGQETKTPTAMPTTLLVLLLLPLFLLLLLLLMLVVAVEAVVAAVVVMVMMMMMMMISSLLLYLALVRTLLTASTNYSYRHRQARRQNRSAKWSVQGAVGSVIKQMQNAREVEPLSAKQGHAKAVTNAFYAKRQESGSSVNFHGRKSQNLYNK